MQPVQLPDAAALSPLHDEHGYLKPCCQRSKCLERYAERPDLVAVRCSVALEVSRDAALARTCRTALS